MCFPRKPALSHHHGIREQWKEAWRLARILTRAGGQLPAACAPLIWKACLILIGDRSEHAAQRTCPLAGWPGASPAAVLMASERVNRRHAELPLPLQAVNRRMD